MVLYLFRLILHRRKAGEHQELLRILTEEDIQNQEIVDMSDNSIIALSEKRGEKRGLPRGIELGETLLEMLAGELADVLDFERVEQLDRSFISDELSEQESDMIFSVPLREPTAKCEEVIIYILIAQESTVDPLMMGFRLLSYMMRIWMEERRSWIERKLSKAEWRLTPIVPVVFYIGPGAWKSPLSLTALMDLPDTLKRFVPTFDTLFLDVKATDPDELTQTGDEYQEFLRIFTQGNIQYQDLLDMTDIMIELGEQRGEQYGILKGILQGFEQGARRTSAERISPKP